MPAIARRPAPVASVPFVRALMLPRRSFFAMAGHAAPSGMLLPTLLAVGDLRVSALAASIDRRTLSCRMPGACEFSRNRWVLDESARRPDDRQARPRHGSRE